MFALPCARTNQDNGNGGVSDVLVANFLANRGGLQAFVVNVPRIDRLVHDALSHHAHEIFFVLDVSFMEAYEDVVSGNSASHSYLISS